MADNKKLYDNLLKSGKVTANELGDFNTFDSLLQDKTNATKLYNNLRKNDLFTVNELGDENTFLSLAQSTPTQKTIPVNGEQIKSEPKKEQPIPQNIPWEKSDKIENLKNKGYTSAWTSPYNFDKYVTKQQNEEINQFNAEGENIEAKGKEINTKYQTQINDFQKQQQSEFDALSKEHETTINKLNSDYDKNIASVKTPEEHKKITAEYEKQFAEETQRYKQLYDEKINNFNDQYSKIAESESKDIDKLNADVEKINKDAQSKSTGGFKIKTKILTPNEVADIQKLVENAPNNYDQKKKYVEDIVDQLTLKYEGDNFNEFKDELYAVINEKLLFDKDGKVSTYNLKNQAEIGKISMADELDKVNKWFKDNYNKIILEYPFTSPEYEKMDNKRKLLNQAIKNYDLVHNLPEGESKGKIVTAGWHGWRTGGEGGFGQGWRSNPDLALNTLTAGAINMAKMIADYGIAQKAQKGEPLLPEEQELLDSSVLLAATTEKLSPGFSTKYQVGKAVAQSLEWMFSMGMTSGFYAPAKLATMKALGWQATKKITAKKVGQVLAGEAVGAAARVPFQPAFYTDVLRERANIQPIAGKYVGEIKGETKLPTVGLMRTVGNAYYSNWAENISEVSGGYLDLIGSKGLQFLAKKHGLEALGRVPKTKVAQAFRGFQKATKLNEPISEWGEEKIAEVLHWVDGSTKPKDFFDAKQNWITFLSVATMMAPIKTIQLTLGAKGGKGVADFLNKKQLAEVNEILTISDVESKAKKITDFIFENKIEDPKEQNQLARYVWDNQQESVASEIKKEEVKPTPEPVPTTPRYSRNGIEISKEVAEETIDNATEPKDLIGLGIANDDVLKKKLIETNEKLQIINDKWVQDVELAEGNQELIDKADADFKKAMAKLRGEKVEVPEVEVPKEVKEEPEVELSKREKNLISFSQELPDIMDKALQKQIPFRDAFLKRKGLTFDEVSKLEQEEKDKLQNEWVKSPEFIEMNKEVIPEVPVESKVVEEKREAQPVKNYKNTLNDEKKLENDIYNRSKELYPELPENVDYNEFKDIISESFYSVNPQGGDIDLDKEIHTLYNQLTEKGKEQKHATVKEELPEKLAEKKTDISELQPSVKQEVPESEQKKITVKEEKIEKEDWEKSFDEFKASEYDKLINSPQYQKAPDNYKKTLQKDFEKSIRDDYSRIQEKAYIEGKEVKRKPIWSMTAKEWAESMDDTLDSTLKETHEKAVREAIKENKPVPDNVKAEYPELFKEEVKFQAEAKGYSFFAKALGLVKTDLVSSLGKTARNGKINGVDVVIQQGDNANEAIIESIRTPWLFRGRGKATNALRKLTAEADRMGITLKLRAVPEKGAKISQQQLQSWYEKNGFVFAKGSNLGIRKTNIKLQAERLRPIIEEETKYEVKINGEWYSKSSIGIDGKKVGDFVPKLMKYPFEKVGDTGYYNPNYFTEQQWNAINKELTKLGFEKRPTQDWKTFFNNKGKKQVFNEHLIAFDKVFGKEKVEKSTSQKIITKAKRYFGLTSNFKEVGYLTPDGDMLDFSGRKFGGGRNTRSMDHREINIIDTDMREFINMGNIRMHPESGSIELNRMPTKEQIKTLFKYFQYFNGDAYVDFVNPETYQVEHFVEYNKAKASKIIGDITNYYQNGIKPISSVKYHIRPQGKENERFAPTPKKVFDTILDKLFGTKLAKAVITDKARMLEKLNQYGIKKLGEPTNKVAYMATTSGEVYGFTTPEGEIYIDPDKININTPIHEYGHLWINWAKTQAKDLFDKGMKLADDKTNPYFQKIWNNPAYAKQRQQYEQGEKEAFLEEVLATAIGDKGEQFVNAKQKSDFKQWLKDLFEAIKEVLGISQYSAEQLQDITFDEFSKAVAVELLKGEEIKARSNIDKATQLYYDLQDAEGASKKRSLAKQRRELIESDPRLKYIDDNIKEINSQLEKQGIIKKEGACP